MIIVYVFYSRVWWMLTDKYVYMDFRGIAFLALMADKFNQEVLQDELAHLHTSHTRFQCCVIHLSHFLLVI